MSKSIQLKQLRKKHRHCGPQPLTKERFGYFAAPGKVTRLAPSERNEGKGYMKSPLNRPGKVCICHRPTKQPKHSFADIKIHRQSSINLDGVYYHSPRGIVTEARPADEAAR